MITVVEYTLALLFLLGFAWLPGYALERLLLRERDLAGLRGLARAVLGIASWIAVAFALATVGWLTSLALGCVAVTSAGSALWAWRLDSRSISGRPAEPDERGGRDDRGGRTPFLHRFVYPGRWESWVGASLIAALLAPFFFLSMGPGVSWDADVYHLTLPRLFLEHEGFRAVPLNIYSQWPLGGELLFALAMLVKDYVLAKLVHFSFGVLTVVALAIGCRVFHRATTGTLAALLLLANPVVLFELPIAYVDLAYAFFFTCAFLFAFHALELQEQQDRRRDSSANWLMSGLCCGLIAGLKVTGIVATPAIAALAVPSLLAAWRKGTGAATALRFALCFGGPVLALWLPWLAKAWFYTGNPIHPLAYSLLGGVDWSATLAVEFTRWQQSIGMGREALDYVLLPLRVILQGDAGYAHFDGAIGRFWIVLLPMTLVFGWSSTLARRALAVSAVYFIAWAMSSQQMRFLIPLLPLLSLAAASTCVNLFDRLGRGSGSWLRRAAILSCALAIATLHRDTLSRGLEIAARTPYEVSRQAAASVPGVFQFIDRSLPDSAVLLFANTSRGFFSPREYLADSFFEASQIADWLRGAETVKELRALLAQRGISHILFENRSWGIQYPAALRELLRTPMQAEAIYRSTDRRITLFELH